MTKNEQVANIMCFLSIMFGEDDQQVFERILKFHPNYLIDKFNRYIESTRIEFPWGLHPGLRAHAFNVYMKKWEIELGNDYGEKF